MRNLITDSDGADDETYTVELPARRHPSAMWQAFNVALHANFEVGQCHKGAYPHQAYRENPAAPACGRLQELRVARGRACVHARNPGLRAALLGAAGQLLRALRSAAHASAPADWPPVLAEQPTLLAKRNEPPPALLAGGAAEGAPALRSAGPGRPGGDEASTSAAIAAASRAPLPGGMPRRFNGVTKHK
jgi:hypothetical protein